MVLEPLAGQEVRYWARKRERRWTKAVAVGRTRLTAPPSRPVLLLVVCQDRATAEWACGPFRLGGEGWTTLTVHPVVLGPGNVPVITRPEEAARNLALATFCALIHGSDEEAPAILEALARALAATDPKSATYYSEILETGLGNTKAREIWRAQMATHVYFPGHGTLSEDRFLHGLATGRGLALIESRRGHAARFEGGGRTGG